MADNQLQDLEDWLKPLVERLKPAARAKLARTMARELRKRQQARVGRQQNADGTSYDKRKPRNVREMHFKYRDQAGNITERTARVQADGRGYHGHDNLRKAFRSFSYRGIVEVYKSRSVKAKSRARMLVRLARRMTFRAGPNGLEVGFTGKAADLARIHQEGLVDQVAKGGPMVQYPVRELLGLSADDRGWIIDQLIEHLNRP
ncbi:MAG: phage virion morphogenesis protein [Pseudomonadota bacterium]